MGFVLTEETLLLLLLTFDELVFMEANILLLKLLMGDFSKLSELVFNARLGDEANIELTGIVDEPLLPPAFT